MSLFHDFEQLTLVHLKQRIDSFNIEDQEKFSFFFNEKFQINNLI